VRNNPEGGESDPAECVHRLCKKNSPVLFCIGKKIKIGCDRGSEVWTVHSGRDGRASFSEETEGICQLKYRPST